MTKVTMRLLAHTLLVGLASCRALGTKQDNTKVINEFEAQGFDPARALADFTAQFYGDAQDVKPEKRGEEVTKISWYGGSGYFKSKRGADEENIKVINDIRDQGFDVDGALEDFAAQFHDVAQDVKAEKRDEEEVTEISFDGGRGHFKPEKRREEVTKISWDGGSGYFKSKRGTDNENTKVVNQVKAQGFDTLGAFADFTAQFQDDAQDVKPEKRGEEVTEISFDDGRGYFKPEKRKDLKFGLHGAEKIELEKRGKYVSPKRAPPTPGTLGFFNPSSPLNLYSGFRRLVRREELVYQQFTGNGSPEHGWPTVEQWKSFDELWAINERLMGASCSNHGWGEDNTEQEMLHVKTALQQVADEVQVDDRFIFAIVMQESKGCVRAPHTNNGVHNPGLMQSHNGGHSCMGVFPCPIETIVGMIRDGAAGTGSGDGLKQLLEWARATFDEEEARAHYGVARKYNSGSCDPNDLNFRFSSTACYASDVANRLIGWTTNGSCKL